MAGSTLSDSFIRTMSPSSVLINSGLSQWDHPCSGKIVLNSFRPMSYSLSNQKKGYLFPSYASKWCRANILVSWIIHLSSVTSARQMNHTGCPDVRHRPNPDQEVRSAFSEQHGLGQGWLPKEQSGCGYQKKEEWISGSKIIDTHNWVLRLKR